MNSEEHFELFQGINGKLRTGIQITHTLLTRCIPCITKKKQNKPFGFLVINTSSDNIIIP